MNAMKKVPLRKCAACGEMRAKGELVRVIKSNEDVIEIDFTGKKNGRGAYICKTEICVNKAEKTKALERSLKAQVPKEIYDQLKKELENK